METMTLNHSFRRNKSVVEGPKVTGRLSCKEGEARGWISSSGKKPLAIKSEDELEGSNLRNGIWHTAGGASLEDIYSLWGHCS